MAYFMANGRTNSAVVISIVCLGQKVWRLKVGGGEYNLIETWIVVSIDLLGGHKPFVSVNGLTQLTDVLIVAKGAGAFYIAH